MNKELQDLVWSILPKEFKEEVKRKFQLTDADCIAYEILIDLFGYHNLTSDAEGEEMLCVSRKEVIRNFKEQVAWKNHHQSSQHDRDIAMGWCNALQFLFGSKCLPDEDSSNVEKLEKNGEVEPKPAEPKFKPGDKVLKKDHNYENEGCPYDIFLGYIGHDKGGYLCAVEAHGWIMHESDLEPYNEPEEEVSKMKPIESKVRVYLVTKEEDEEFRQLLHKNGFEWNTGESLIDNSVWSFDKEESKIHNIYPNKIVTYSGDITPNILSFYKFKKQYFEENANLSQETSNCDNHFDNIFKDSFAKERRLNIAAMIIQGIMANPNPQW